MASERVVVTGVGVLAPNAHGADAFVEALRHGVSGIRHLSLLAELGFGCQVGGIPQGVEELKTRYLSSSDLLAMNPNMIYAAIAAKDAWTDAGLVLPSPGDDAIDWDTGAVIGTGIGGIDTVAEKLVPKVQAGRVARLGSTMVEQIMSSGNSAAIGGLLGLGNQVTTNSSACNTGTEAIVMASERLRSGRAKRMLAGGSEGHCHYTWAGFDAMKVLNRTMNEDPARASRPLSATARGFVPGSGAGILMLETLTSARARGARIYAELLGGALNCGGHRMGGTMTAANPVGVQRCIRAAIEMAQVKPREIDAINGHLTATSADPNEVRNWSRALELAPEQMPRLHATKSLIGHSLGAAGGIECVAVVLELHHRFIHGSANCEDLHPELAEYSDRIQRETIDLPDLRIIAKASFGFGDVNGCVVFRRWEA